MFKYKKDKTKMIAMKSHLWTTAKYERSEMFDVCDLTASIVSLPKSE